MDDELTPTPEVPPRQVRHDPRPGAWRTLARALAPRPSRGQLLAGLLCALLGFGLVVQVRQTHADNLASLSQDDLVRLLDEVTQRRDTLQEQAVTLRSTRAQLVTGADTEKAALAAAANRAAVQGILAGQLPAEGPGVRLVLTEGASRLSAASLVNIMEELRSAGAEAIQVNDRRLTASSYIVDTSKGVDVDGVSLTAPYQWLAIGDPDTILPALEMPGGALAAIRGVGGDTEITGLDHVVVGAVRQLTTPRFATPAPSSSPSASSG
jgi:uncharacterized protein YlxW (UPF0749 family)